MDHGNAWSLYFRDPEGNRLEVFCDTQWYVEQPCLEDLDLSCRPIRFARSPMPSAGLHRASADRAISRRNSPKMGLIEAL